MCSQRRLDRRHCGACLWWFWKAQYRRPCWERCLWCSAITSRSISTRQHTANSCIIHLPCLQWPLYFHVNHRRMGWTQRSSAKPTCCVAQRSSESTWLFTTTIHLRSPNHGGIDTLALAHFTKPLSGPNHHIRP